MIVIIMGVSGSGKSTVGSLLAKSLGWKFRDADSFHPQANIDKMSRGIPLTDGDRTPWLVAMQNAIALWLEEKKNVVLACSALKASYRQILLPDPQQMRLVYLTGSKELINQRLLLRQNHYMKTDLLESQFDTLEEPAPEVAIYVDVALSPEAIAQQIILQL